MNEQESVEFMLKSFIEENRQLAERAGMPAEDFDSQMTQSLDSLRYMFGNLYAKMKESGIIA